MICEVKLHKIQNVRLLYNVSIYINLMKTGADMNVLDRKKLKSRSHIVPESRSH